MIFKAPELRDKELEVLDEISKIRKQVKYATSAPRRWSGMLRRNLLAGAIRGSNSIEGYNASVEDAIAVVQHDEPFTAEGETLQALRGYRNAMTFVLQLARDPNFSYQEGFIRSLHYMMIYYDLSKNPGNWRPGSIFVRDEARNVVVYEGPARESVEPLMAEFISSLNAKSGAPEIVKAAMAHLNLVMIHPFSDGNGRMARCLQTLVLAREGILEPEFCSVEEYLGKVQQNYYDVLAKVGAGAWHPERDTRSWIRFMLTAHLAQAHRILWATTQLDKLWDEAARIGAEKHLPERALQPVVDATIGLKIRNSSYRKFANISENLASRDLKQLVDAGLLVPSGEKRGRVYVASKELEELRVRVVEPFVQPEPFSGEEEEQPLLPGLF